MQNLLGRENEVSQPYLHTPERLEGHRIDPATMELHRAR